MLSGLFVLCHRPVRWLLLGMSFRVSTFEIASAVICFGFGVLLIVLGRLKAMQEMQFYQAMISQRYPRISQRGQHTNLNEFEETGERGYGSFKLPHSLRSTYARLRLEQIICFPWSSSPPSR
jgi:hypothetical protein